MSLELPRPNSMARLIAAAGAAVLLFSCAARAAEFYVAPDGNDQNSGAREQPFASLQRAQDAASPGDLVYIRGGLYEPRLDQIARIGRLYASVFYLDKSGKPGAPIRYWAFPGEQPVFDFSAITPERKRVAAFDVPGSWIHLKGLEVIGVQVTIQRHTQSICFYNNGSHNTYELLSMHDGQAIGIYSVNGSSNLFLNCDAFRNYDYTSENGRGGNVDGFGCHPPRGATGNVFRGCRAWYNSDDGFDCINAHEAVVFENCWAFLNGLSPDGTRRADGNGFKAGGYASTPTHRLPSPIPRHVVRFSVAAANKASGFYANHHPGGIDWLHNSAYRNGINFNMLGRTPDNLTDIPGRGHMLKNNLGFRGGREILNLDPEHQDAAGNYWNLNLVASTNDFQSLEVNELTAPRQPDGNLPEIRFMHLAEGSAFIDTGVKLTNNFAGAASDPGAFEYRSSVSEIHSK